MTPLRWFAAAVVTVSLAGASSSPALGTQPNPPLELTAWRTPQGIFLSWSVTPAGEMRILRGTAPGRIETRATLPGGQSGFLDLAAMRTQEYWYVVETGDRRGAPLRVPGAAAPVRVLTGLVTTCSGLAPGGTFPANTQNYFYRSRNAHVQFYGYYFLRPYDPSPREVKLVWRDPKGEVFSEYSHQLAPRPVQIKGETVGQMLAPQAIGLREVVAQNGQKRLPEEPGMYTVEAFIDDIPVSLTVFYLKEEDAKGAPVPAAPPAAPAESGGK